MTISANGLAVVPLAYGDSAFPYFEIQATNGTEARNASLGSLIFPPRYCDCPARNTHKPKALFRNGKRALTGSMILQNCVLILGAGASHPYGFPCGEKFRDGILNVAGKGQFEHAMNAFKEQFSGPDLASIDRFLEECQKRPEREPFPNKVIIEMGKAAIAHVLLPCENPASTVRDWYGSLVDALTKGYLEEQAKKLTVITFNYDRSLEFHLLRSFKAIDGGRKFDGEKVRKMIEIIHVYGQLGELPDLSNSQDLVGYGSESEVSTAMKGIRVIGDRTEDAHLKLIRSKIKEADALAFIGFGFLDENMDLLQIPQKAEKPAFASAFDLGQGKRARLRSNYPNLNWVFGSPGSDAKRFLHDTDFFSALTSKEPNALATLACGLP